MTSFNHHVNGRARPVRRVTVGSLGGSYGIDHGRRLVVELSPGDVIVFRPHGTRRRYTARAIDLFGCVIRGHAQVEINEKLIKFQEGQKA